MLDDMEKTISMAAFAKNPEGVVTAVESGDARYRIKGRNAILVDREYFAMMEDWVVASELVVWKDHIEQGLREAKAGKGRDLREVLQEIGLEHIYDEARGRAASGATGTGGSKNRPVARRTRKRPTRGSTRR